MIDFTLDDEQHMLRASIERFAERHDGRHARQALSAGRISRLPDHWPALAELGVLGLTVPEPYGGLGRGPVDTLIVMEALGRRLLGEPLLSGGVLAAAVLLAAGDEGIKARLLPRLVRGELRLAVACCEPEGGFDLADIRTRASRRRDHFEIDGAKSIVLHADEADAIVVPARTSADAAPGDGITLFIVPRDAAGLALDSRPTIDAHRAAQLSLRQVRVCADDVLGTVGEGGPPLERAVDAAIAAACAEAVGVMAAMLEDTVAFLNTRTQFGQPLANFQALRHRVADMHIGLEQARSAAAMAAAGMAAPERSARRRAVSAAKVLVGRHARALAHEAVQLHGAIGTTDELAIGHCFKRLHGIDVSWGARRQHLAAYSALMDA